MNEVIDQIVVGHVGSMHDAFHPFLADKQILNFTKAFLHFVQFGSFFGSWVISSYSR